jgi:hypothetical protein
MAIVIPQIEKEFLLGMLRYKDIPVICFIAKKEHTLILRLIEDEQLVFESQDDLSVFEKNMKIDLKFSVQSVLTPIITFSVYVCEITHRRIATTVPDHLYKNLERSYSRVQQPPEVTLVLKKDGFYYDLNYERLNVPDAIIFEDTPADVNDENIEALMNINLDWLKQTTDGYKLVLFKNDRPVTIEEKAVGKLGKIFFISIPDGGFIPETKNPMDLCFTEQSFAAFLVESGIAPAEVQEKTLDLFRRRTAQGICSDCYIPIIFSLYVIGYVHVWVYERSKEPLTINTVDRIRQFTSIIAFFLNRKNFFEAEKKELPAFNPKLLDISAGGFLFALDLNNEKVFYALNDAFTVKIIIFDRVIHCKAVVTRDYTNKIYAFYGCKFDDMELEDIRFFFESIYGKPFTGKELDFITGSV